MEAKNKFLFRISTAAVIIATGTLLFNACQKDTKVSTSLQTTSASSTSSATAAAAFDSTMDSLAKKSLVARYSFDSGSLMDRSKHHNDIIFSNAIPDTDRYGRPGFAYRFNGNGSYMQIKNSRSLNPITEITLFAIIKVKGFYGGTCRGNNIIDKGLSNTYGHYFLGFDDGLYTNQQNCFQKADKRHESFDANYGNGGSGQISSVTDSVGFVQTGRWYRVAYTYANGVSSLYVNGKIYASNKEANYTPNQDDLFLGKRNSSQFPDWFNGIIDDVAIFNKALSNEEIASLSKL